MKARLKRDIEIAEKDEDIELANRLRRMVDALSRAECGNASKTDLQEAVRIIREGRRLLFVLKMTERREEFRGCVSDGNKKWRGQPE